MPGDGQRRPGGADAGDAERGRAHRARPRPAQVALVGADADVSPGRLRGGEGRRCGQGGAGRRRDGSALAPGRVVAAALNDVGEVAGCAGGLVPADRVGYSRADGAHAADGDVARRGGERV